MLFLFFSLLFLYALYQGRFLILGPRLSLVSPQDNEVLTGPVVTVSGTARNVAWLTLNGGAIFTDQSGLFSEKLLVATGTSIIELKARDHFGREKEVHIRVTLP